VIPIRQRAIRVAEAIKGEVGLLLLHHLKDPRIGFASVTDVEVSGDLSKAVIYFSVVGSEEEIKNTWAGLQSSKGMIRSWLAQSMKLRTTPEIELALDDSIARGSRILELMKDFESETIPEDDPEYGSLATDGDC